MRARDHAIRSIFSNVSVLAQDEPRPLFATSGLEIVAVYPEHQLKHSREPAENRELFPGLDLQKTVRPIVCID
jgi:hypothetical protein